MKALFLLIAFTLGANAQEARQLDTSEFQKLDTPVKTRPVMIPKSANAKVPKPGDITINKGARLVVLPDLTQQESPLVDIPILFDVNTANLHDAVSRSNVRLLAEELIKRSSQGQAFSIAGLASADGDERRNDELSLLRAARIQQELRSLGVPAAAILKVEGFGSRQATAKASDPEPLRQQDRRVVVIKEK